MLVTFVRHAESEFNRDPTCPTPDCPLTDEGCATATALTGAYELVVVSPLQRARQTFALSRVTFGRMRVEPLVREFRLDRCDFFEDEDHCRLETDDELMDRGTYFLEWVRAQPVQSVLVVSHGDFICSLTGVLLNNLETTSLILPRSTASIH